MSYLEDDYRSSLMDRAIDLPDKWNYNLRYSVGDRAGKILQVDAAYTLERISIEIQGGTRSARGGVHLEPGGYRADREKSNWGQLHGWLMLEFTIEHVRSGYAAETTRAALEARRVAAHNSITG